MLRRLVLALVVLASSSTLVETAEARPTPRALSKPKPKKKGPHPVTPIPAKDPPLTVTPPVEKNEQRKEEAPKEEVPKTDEPAAPTTTELAAEAPKAEAPSPVPAAPPSPEPESSRKLELGGRIFSYVRVPFSTTDPIQQVSTSAWLDARARMSEGTFANLSLVGDLLTPSIEEKVEGRARLREAYVAAHKDGIEARIGQQIVSWGNADIVHPVDFLSARDLAFFSVSEDVRQIGAPSVLVSYSPEDGTSPLRVTLVWQPVFPVSRTIVPKEVKLAQFTVADEERGRLSLADSELAMKLGWAPGGWDIGLIGFRGSNHISEPYLKSLDLAAGKAVIGRSFHPILGAGAQASMTADAWVLRAEGAYIHAQDNADASNPRLIPSHVDAVIGVERSIGERFRVSAQGIVRWFPTFVNFENVDGAPAVVQIKRSIAEANSLIQGYTHQTRPGATLFLGWSSEDEKLEVGCGMMAYFVGFDWVITPTVGYRLFGALKLDVGAQVFGGKLNSLGALRDYSGAFAQATYAF